MASPDPIVFRLWLIIFRTLSLGMLVMGALATIGGAIIAVAAVLPEAQRIPGVSLGYGVLSIVVGVTFVVIGFRGFKMRTRRDLETDMSKTASDREKLERWINR